MQVANTTSITAARKNIFNIVEAVQKPNTYFTLTDKGKPKAVIMAAEEFESWLNTLQVANYISEIDTAIEEANHDLFQNRFEGLPLNSPIEDALKEIYPDVMPTYEVQVSRKTWGELEQLAQKERWRVQKALYSLAYDANLGKPLAGKYGGYYSLTIWPYVLIYKISSQGREVVVL